MEFVKNIESIETSTLLTRSQDYWNESVVFGVVAIIPIFTGFTGLPLSNEGFNSYYWFDYFILALYFLAGASCLGIAFFFHIKVRKIEKEVARRKDQYAISFLNERKVKRAREMFFAWGFFAALFVIVGILLPSYNGAQWVGTFFLTVGVGSMILSLYYALTLRRKSHPL